MLHQDIFSFIKDQENTFQTGRVPVSENYDWPMYDHIKTAVLYKNSIFIKGKDENKPFRNIIRPLLNLQYRAEGFDVKDIEIYVNEAENYHKSFLLRKYHEKWAVENEMDTFIDEMVESYVTFGGALVKKLPKSPRPEVVPLQRVAFCDQTDILSGVIAEKHFYSPDQLLEIGKQHGWDMDAVDELIIKSEYGKEQAGKSIEAKTPSTFIEIYEVHGSMPSEWLKESDKEDYVRQIHIVGFYHDEKSKAHGVTLLKKEEFESPYDFISRDAIYGRALGTGGVEELEEAQVWTNYAEIRKKKFLDATRVLYQTSDERFANRNQTTKLDDGEILVHSPNAPLTQVNTFPSSFQLFDNAANEWLQHAQLTSSASDPLLGESPKSGTPFKLQELVTNMAQGNHEYRKGKLASFTGRIYRNWIVPQMAKEVTREQEFLASLDLDELQEIGKRIVENEANNAMKEAVLSGKTFALEEVEMFKQRTFQEFLKGGEKRFLKILKGEMKDAPLEVRINVAGKQKYMAQSVDKLVNILRAIPQIAPLFQVPGVQKVFNEILENSGLSPINFAGITMPQMQPQQAPVEAQAVPQMI